MCTQVRGRGPGAAGAEEVRFRDITVGQLRDLSGGNGPAGWGSRQAVRGFPTRGWGLGRALGQVPPTKCGRAPKVRGRRATHPTLGASFSFPTPGHLAWVWDTSTSTSASQALAPAFSSPVFQAGQSQRTWAHRVSDPGRGARPLCLSPSPLGRGILLAGEVLSQRRSPTIWRPSPRPLSLGVGKICCQSTSPQRRLKTQRTQKAGDWRPPCLGLREGGKTGWGRGQCQLDWQAKVRLSWHSSSRDSGQ